MQWVLTELRERAALGDLWWKTSFDCFSQGLVTVTCYYIDPNYQIYCRCSVGIFNNLSTTVLLVRLKGMGETLLLKIVSSIIKGYSLKQMQIVSNWVWKFLFLCLLSFSIRLKRYGKLFKLQRMFKNTIHQTKRILVQNQTHVNCVLGEKANLGFL